MKLITRINLILCVTFLLALLLVGGITYLLTEAHALPEQPAQQIIVSLIVLTAIVFLILFLVVNVILRKFVLKPVSQITRMADEFSNGNLSAPNIKVTGEDEMADMLHAFNRMRRGVVKIVQVAKKLQAQAKSRP